MSKNKKNQKSEKKKSPPRRDPSRKFPAGQFPKNFRFITDNIISRYIHKHRKRFLIGFTTLLILLAIATVSLDAYLNYKENKRFIQERARIGKEIKFWQSTVDRFPNYRDAYFELALLHYQLKDFGKARKYLGQTLKLDPNFKEAHVLESKLK